MLESKYTVSKADMFNTQSELKTFDSLKDPALLFLNDGKLFRTNLEFKRLFMLTDEEFGGF